MTRLQKRRKEYCGGPCSPSTLLKQLFLSCLVWVVLFLLLVCLFCWLFQVCYTFPHVSPLAAAHLYWTLDWHRIIHSGAGCYGLLFPQDERQWQAVWVCRYRTSSWERISVSLLMFKVRWDHDNIIIVLYMWLVFKNCFMSQVDILASH